LEARGWEQEGRRGRKRRGGKKEVVMTQSLYAYMNKGNLKRNVFSCVILVILILIS
jgi:hypothetical protein